MEVVAREEDDGAGGDFGKRSRTKNSLVLAASAACHFQSLGCDAGGGSGVQTNPVTAVDTAITFLIVQSRQQTFSSRRP